MIKDNIQNGTNIQYNIYIKDTNQCKILSFFGKRALIKNKSKRGFGLLALAQSHQRHK